MPILDTRRLRIQDVKMNNFDIRVLHVGIKDFYFEGKNVCDLKGLIDNSINLFLIIL